MRLDGALDMSNSEIYWALAFAYTYCLTWESQGRRVDEIEPGQIREAWDKSRFGTEAQQDKDILGWRLQPQISKRAFFTGHGKATTPKWCLRVDWDAHLYKGKDYE